MTLFVYIDLNFSFNFGHYYNIFNNIQETTLNSGIDLLLVNSEWKYYSEEVGKSKFPTADNFHRVLLNNNPEDIERLVNKYDFKKYSRVVLYVYKGGVEFIKPLCTVHDYLSDNGISFEIWNTLFIIPFDHFDLSSNTFDAVFETEINKSKALLKSRNINLCFDISTSIWNKYFDDVKYLPPPLLKDAIIKSRKRAESEQVKIAIDVWNLSYAPKYRNENIELLKSYILDTLDKHREVVFKIKISDSQYNIHSIKDKFFLDNPRIEIYGFLSEDEYNTYLSETDIYILQYSPTFYKNKSSGHFLELLTKDVFIIGTKNTFLEENLQKKLHAYEFGNLNSLIEVTERVLNSKAYLQKSKPNSNIQTLIKSWTKDHFKENLIRDEKTSDNSIKGKRTDKPFIVLGNGPSLKGFDFSKLNDFDTIGMNAAYRYWDRINWYPTYYICLDTVVVKSHHKEINRLVQESDKLGIKKFFVRRDLFELEPQLENHPKVITYEDMKQEKPLAFDCVHVTTGSFAARLAINEGYTDIFLLGIDETYVNFIKESKRKEDIKLEIVETPQSNPNYFFDDYQQKGDLYQIANHSKVYKCSCRHCKGDIRDGRDLHIDAWKFIEMDIEDPEFINEYGRIEIINCNPKSAVKFFPFNEFELAVDRFNRKNTDSSDTSIVHFADELKLDLNFPIFSFNREERVIEKKRNINEIIEKLEKIDISINFRSKFDELSFEQFSDTAPPMPFIVDFLTLFDLGLKYRLAIKTDKQLKTLLEFDNTFEIVNLRLLYNRNGGNLKVFVNGSRLISESIENIEAISKLSILGAGFKSRYWKGEIFDIIVKDFSNGEDLYKLSSQDTNINFRYTEKKSLDKIFEKSE